MRYSYACHGRSGAFSLTLWTAEHGVFEFDDLINDIGMYGGGGVPVDQAAGHRWTPDVYANPSCTWHFAIIETTVPPTILPVAWTASVTLL